MFHSLKAHRRTRERLMPAAKRLILLLFLLAMTVAAAHAQQPVGELELKKGVVKILREGRSLFFRQPKVRTPVFAGDELHSARNTRATIYFRDGRDTISLYAKSLFKIEEVSERRSFFGLSIGKAFFKVLSKFRTNRFTVQTPTATIGVKGTEFVTATDGLKTFVLTLTGVVALANVDFPEREVLIKANQASTVEPRTLPAPPVEVDTDDQADIVAEEGTESFEDLPFEVPPPEEPEGDVGTPPVVAIVDELQEITNAIATAEEVTPSDDPGLQTVLVDISVSR